MKVPVQRGFIEISFSLRRPSPIRGLSGWCCVTRFRAKNHQGEWPRATLERQSGDERQRRDDVSKSTKCQHITPETPQGNRGVMPWNKNCNVLGCGVSFIIFNNNGHGCLLKKIKHPRHRLEDEKKCTPSLSHTIKKLIDEEPWKGENDYKLN